MEPSSFSGSSRRARPPANIAQVAHCLVDGCLADLSLCKDYHRRHKVCEIHSKTPKVSIRGREQRFCQQCSRFHSLVEFDGEKKSCRKRLDGHNRRRRKTQPDSLTRNLGLDFSNQQGTTLLSFSTPQILPSAVVGLSWAGVVKTEHDMGPLCNNQQQQQQQLNYMETPNSSCPSQSSYKGVNHLELIQGSEMYSDGLNQVVDSDGALSLLSSASPVTREFSLNNVLRAEPLPRASSLVNNMQYGGLGHLYQLAQDSKQTVVTSSDSHGTDAGSTLQFSEMFQHGAEGSSSSGSHQTLTFMWE